MSRSYHIRPFNQTSIAWSTSRRRYYRDAELVLEELIEVADQVVKAWPPGLPEIAQLEKEHPDLHRLCRRRDRLSNVVMMFAAIAIEAFINFYGVYRLGEKQFTRHVERLPIQRKLELLLMICDGVEIEETEPVVTALKFVVERRNRLAHPKSREVSPDQPPEQRMGENIPDSAINTVQSMKDFFRAFGDLVPESKPLLPGQPAATTVDGVGGAVVSVMPSPRPPVT